MASGSLQDRLAALTPDQRRRLWEKLAAAGDGGAGDGGGAAGIRSDERGDPPLSAAQERLWLAHRLEPGGASQTLGLTLRLAGPVDAAALDRALAEIVRRHEALRTAIGEAGGMLVQIVRPVDQCYAGLAVVHHRERLPDPAAMARADAAQPLDPQNGRVLAAVLHAAPLESALLLSVHHIAFDARSQSVFLAELAALYAAFCAGVPSTLPDPARQYTDFARWERRDLAGPRAATALAYWRERLAGALTGLDLPLDHGRPATLAGPAGWLPVEVPAETATALQDLARGRGATLFAALLAAWSALLHRITGQRSIVTGVPVSVRPRREFEELIGCFLNTLPLRVDVAGEERFTDLLDRVRVLALDALEHAGAPFERVLVAPGAGRGPGLQSMFALRGEDRPPALPGLTVELAVARPTALQFDLTLDVVAPESGGWTAALVFRADLFEAETARRIAACLAALLSGIADRPEQRVAELPLLAGAERSRLLAAWHEAGRVAADPPAVLQRIEAQARQRPDAVAVIAGDAEITYAELDRATERVAGRLHALGVGPGEVVGLVAPRAIPSLVGLIGILKAGAAYLPLDPASPRERNGWMILDAGARVVLAADPASAAFGAAAEVMSLEDARLPDAATVAVPRPECWPHDPAYVIYTSGSTGRPKGVLVEHGSLARLVDYACAAHGLGPGDRVLQFHALSFDASVEDIFPCLAAGATLVLRSDRMIASPAGFWRELAGLRITVASLPASFVRRLAGQMPEDAAGLALRLLVVGGERADPRSLAAIHERLAPGVRVVNQYGPTEATVVAAAYELPPGPCSRSDEVPIGKPPAYVVARVLDGRLNPCPPGLPGELCLGGAGLARGYLAQPALTAERFVPDPFSPEPGARLYRTGDRVRLLPDGNLAFLGRLDRQVKLNGYRIEPGEIEAALLAHGDVREAYLAVAAAPGDARKLVAYVAPHVEGLAKWLAGRLPAPMLPAAFVALDALPRLPSGKVDAAALPDPPDDAAAYSGSPLTATEELVSGVMAAVLGAAAPGRSGSFFALGGHSLQAAEVTGRLGEAFGIDLPPAALWQHATVGGLAAAIDALAGSPAEGSPAEGAPSEGAPSEGSPSEGASLQPWRPSATEPDAAVPLSPGQLSFWRPARALTGVALFAMPLVLLLEGRLDADALERALAELVRRHRILRSVVVERDGEAAMAALPGTAPAMTRLDLAEWYAAQHAQVPQRLAAAELARPFDLATDPPFRAVLARLGPDRHYLCLSLHHLAGDGASLVVLAEELGHVYGAFATGRPSPLREPALQYADWARRQREWLDGLEAGRQRAYWRAALAGPLPPLEWAGRPRPAARTFRYGCVRLDLPADLDRDLLRLAREHDVTPFMAFLAGLNALLGRYTGGEDIRVGVVAANRTRRGAGRVVGLLANTVVVRTPVPSGLDGRELLRRTRRAALSALAHQDLPFEAVAEELVRGGAGPREGLCPVLLVYQGHPVHEVQAAGVRISPAEDAGGDADEYEFTLSTFDWIVEATPAAGGLAVRLRYDADLFDEESARRALRDLHATLAALAATPAARSC